MKKLSTYLIVMFMVMFWVFRIIVAVTDTVGVNIGFSISNYNIEVALLFITIVFTIPFFALTFTNSNPSYI